MNFAPPLTPPESLESFRGRHRSERCFVVGCAPSLSQLDLTKLHGEWAFTVNRGYLAASMGLPRTPFFLVSDPLTYREYFREIRVADVGLRFYRADVFDLPEYQDAQDREAAVRFPFHLSPAMHEGHFAEDITTGAFRGFSVVLDAVQMAFFMGFGEVYIIGCDLDYQGHQTHVYGSGEYEHRRRNDMPIDKVLRSMSVAHAAFQRHGRLLANAGAGGRLDTIPRLSFDSLFPARPRLSSASCQSVKPGHGIPEGTGANHRAQALDEQIARMLRGEQVANTQDASRASQAAVLKALLAKAAASAAQGHKVLAELVIEEALEKYPDSQEALGAQRELETTGRITSATAMSENAGACSSAEQRSTAKFVSFLLPYVDRGQGPTVFHGIMLKQLGMLGCDRLAIIADEPYFALPAPWNQTVPLGDFRVRLPSRAEFEAVRRISIPPGTFSELDKTCRSHLEALSHLMGEDFPPLRSALVDSLKELKRAETLEAVLSWCNIPSLTAAAAEVGLPVIHNELGPLRPPLYQSTIYFDFRGVNGNTSANADMQSFIREAEACPSFTPLSLADIRSLLAASSHVAEDTHEEPRFKVGVALQVEHDSNLIVFGNGMSNFKAIFAAMRGLKPSQILMRHHPSGQAQYSERLAVVDESPDSVTFLRQCEKVVTINSSVAFECLLQGKPVKIMGDSPASALSCEKLERLSEHDRLLALNYLFICYLVPAQFLFNADYYRWRLTRPSLLEIYRLHLRVFGQIKAAMLPTTDASQPHPPRSATASNRSARPGSLSLWQDLERAQAELRERTLELDQARMALRERSAELDQQRAALHERTRELDDTRADLRSRTEELDRDRQALRERGAELDQARQETQKCAHAARVFHERVGQLSAELDKLRSSNARKGV